MNETATPTTAGRRRVKMRILAGTIADLVIDMLIPTAVYLVLRPAGVPPLLAIAAGGLVVGGKAQLGGIATAHPRSAYAGAVAQVVAGLAVLFGAYAAGVPAPYAMALSALPLAAGLAVSLARRKRIDGFALLVILEVAAGIAVGLISGDPRFVLARSSIYVAIAGVYMLVSCFGRRPMMMVLSKPMAVAGDPLREAAFERAAERSPRFRHLETAMTAVVGAMLLTEAILRVMVVYAYPADGLAQAGIISQIPAIALLVATVLALRLWAVPRLRTIVDTEQQTLRAEQNATA